MLECNALHLGYRPKVPDGPREVGKSVARQGPIEYRGPESGAVPQEGIGLPDHLGVGVEAMEQDKIVEADREILGIDRKIG